MKTIEIVRKLISQPFDNLEEFTKELNMLCDIVENEQDHDREMRQIADLRLNKLPHCTVISEQCRVIAENEALRKQLENSVQLPCKVSDTVYAIAKCSDVKRSLDGSYYSSDGSPGTATGWYCAFDGKENMCPLCGKEECNEQDYAIFESVVEGLNYFAEHNRWELYLDNLDDFKSYHLTKPEAESRLKELNKARV